MGFFNRLGRMIRGFFGLFVGGLEDRNPDALFEEIGNEIEKTRKEAEQQIVDIQTNAELIKIDMKTSEKNLALVKSRIDTARKQGGKDILVELLMQEEECQSVFDTHKSMYENAVAEASKTREDYTLFESEMNARLNEVKSLKSQARMAASRESISAVSARYNARNSRMGNLNESLEKARDVVNRKSARANAIEALNDRNTADKLKKLDLSSARERAEARADVLLGGENTDS